MSEKLQRLVENAFGYFRPPPKLRLSEWAEQYAYLSAESSAEPGKWRNLPYQVGIMDAITDPRVERVTVIKSARVGYTKIIGHAIGYYIHYDPCSIMVVQPTEGDAEGYSKEEIAPMIRDTPVLRDLVADSKSRDSGNTILQKQFPGGTLSLVGANSPRGFRRVSRRIVIFDEVDGYPPSAGPEGDQIKLGIRRTEYFWNRKIIAGSTPTTSKDSRIEPMFEESDQRYFHVPCPTCREFQVLKFPNMKWPEHNPERAYFECIHCRKPIDHRDKRSITEAGRWIAEKEFTGHAGFHIWAAYSYSPNASWGQLAKEFLEANREGQEALKTYMNTVLGETWKQKGEVPDWKRIYERRESYPIGSVPDPVVFLTAGVDVQKDRLEAEIVGWGRDKQSWSIEVFILLGDTALHRDQPGSPWAELDKLLSRTWRKGSGQELAIRMMAVDTGYNTQHVYNWVREHPINRVMAIKGSDHAPVILGQPSSVDFRRDGRRFRRGIKLWTVGTDLAKGELYSWLALHPPTDEEKASGRGYPHGYCHFPQYEEEFFKQLTAEELVARLVKGSGQTGSRGVGRKRYVWEKIRERNEALDRRIYARAAAARVGLDRMTEEQWLAMAGSVGVPVNKPAAAAAQAAPAAGESSSKEARPQTEPQGPAAPRRYGSFLD